MRITDDIRKKILKVYALAKWGEAGEMEAAKERLEKLLLKHGITIDDVVDEDKAEYKFSLPRKKSERTIFTQVMLKVLDMDSVEVSYNHTKSTMFVKLTKTQYIEIVAMYDFYIRAFRKDVQSLLDDYAEAFVLKNDLYPRKKNTEKKDAALSEKETEHLLSVMSLQSRIKRRCFNKQLK